VPFGGLIAEKEVIIAKLHKQLEDEITAHDITKAMLAEVKAEANFLRRTNTLHTDYAVKIVIPMIAILQKEQDSGY
jgi:hypothetical protein